MNGIDMPWLWLLPARIGIRWLADVEHEIRGKVRGQRGALPAGLLIRRCGTSPSLACLRTPPHSGLL